MKLCFEIKNTLQCAYKAFASKYFKSITIIILSVLLIYTYQWLTPYRSSVLNNAIQANRDYSLEEMRTLFIYVVDHTNEECLNVPRDEEGNVCYLIGLIKAIRKQLNKGDGDHVHVIIRERKQENP